MNTIKSLVLNCVTNLKIGFLSVLIYKIRLVTWVVTKPRHVTIQKIKALGGATNCPKLRYVTK
jgi:hypothetical protein